MDLVNIAIIIGTLVFILMLWIAVGVRHLKHLLREIDEQWEFVDERVRKRHNLIPNLVEALKKYDFCDPQEMDYIVKERSLATREYFPTAKKMEYEHDLSSRLNKLMDLPKDHKELLQDMHFLELRTEIDDVEQDIDGRAKKFNEMVRFYNAHRSSVVLNPLSKVFGFKPVNIFEIET